MRDMLKSITNQNPLRRNMRGNMKEETWITQSNVPPHDHQELKRLSETTGTDPPGLKYKKPGGLASKLYTQIKTSHGIQIPCPGSDIKVLTRMQGNTWLINERGRNKKRRGRDSNPRDSIRCLHALQACALNHSATSPLLKTV
jgi:hypothetical protein